MTLALSIVSLAVLSLACEMLSKLSEGSASHTSSVDYGLQNTKIQDSREFRADQNRPTLGARPASCEGHSINPVVLTVAQPAPATGGLGWGPCINKARVYMR